MDEITFEEALNEYYSLKTQYESRAKERNKNNKLDSESALVKPNCINCNRPVGSIFSAVLDKKESRVLKATCGSISEPCDFHIELLIGESFDILEQIENYQFGLKKIKNDIIQFKNDVLFGYKTENDVITDFNVMKDEFNQLNEDLNFFYNKLHEIKDDKKKEELIHLQENINILINKIKELVLKEDYENAVKTYIDELQRILDEKREKLYPVCLVEMHKDPSVTYHLIEEKHSIKDFELQLEEPKVIQFVKTVFIRKGNDLDKKSKKNRKSQKTKTKKSQKKFTNQEDFFVEDEDDENNNEEKEKEQKKINTNTNTNTNIIQKGINKQDEYEEDEDDED